MRKVKYSHPWYIAVRTLADFLVVQSALAGALALVTLGIKETSYDAAVHLVRLRQHYLILLVLSLLYPSIYAVAGLYSFDGPVRLGRRVRRAILASAIAGAAVAGSSFLLTSSSDLLRPTALIFTGLVLFATPGARLLKHWAFEREALLAPAIIAPKGTILVVGGAGYIGSILVRKLLHNGDRVRILDSLVYGSAAIDPMLTHPRLEFIKGDCRNIKDVVAAMAGASAVVHLAAIVGDPACEQDRKTAREVNYAATRMMIEIARGEGVRRFIFASSCSVYGLSDELMHEHSETAPISLYAETKVDSERELLSAASADFHPTILRFSTIFGLSPRPRFDLVVNLLIARALRDEVVTIYNGEQWRPFLHVADAAQSIMSVLAAPIEVVGSQIYNAGDERMNYTLSDVGEKIRRVFPSTRIEHLENSDRRNYRVSFAKIRKDLNFNCSQMIEDGILELKEAFDSGLITDYCAPLYSNVKFLQEHGSPVQTNKVGVQVMAALAHTF